MTGLVSLFTRSPVDRLSSPPSTSISTAKALWVMAETRATGRGLWGSSGGGSLKRYTVERASRNGLFSPDSWEAAVVAAGF